MTRDLPDLYLIRHGQTAWNLQGRLQGHLDSPLTDLGREQAMVLRPLLASLPARRLCSPLGRAVQTARILFPDEPLTLDPRLAEIGLGDFSGRLLADLRRDLPAVFAGLPHDWYDRAPGGEGLAALSRRLSALLDGLTGPAILVTHGVTLAMICALATGQPLAAVHAACQDQGCLHIIRAGHHRIIRPACHHPRPAVETRSAGG